ncbi:unnamed protein product [Tilletia controversa]|nr:unnamed protein product [Tilletia controversa]
MNRGSLSVSNVPSVSLALAANARLGLREWSPSAGPTVITSFWLQRNYLVGAIDEVAKNYGIPKALIGIILLPIVGNAAEHVTALARLPLPASYSDGFEQCVGDIAEYPGIYGASTYYQDEEGDDAPPPHDAPASSNCNPQPSPSNGVTAPGSSSTSASSAAATPAPGASSSVLPPQSGAQTTGGSRSNSAASSNHKLSSSSVLVRFSAGVAGLAALSVLLA